MLSTLLAGALIALSFSAPPGPVAMETLRRGMQGGFRPALSVQLGSIIGDLTWCLAALIGLAPLMQIAWVRWLLGAAGVLLLVYLGALGVRDAMRPAALQPVTAGVVRSGAFRSGLAISMANPMAVGYWLGVGGALAAAGAIGASLTQTAAFVAGFAVAVLAWAFFMALAVRWGKQIITPALFRIVTFVCGATLIVFGVGLAARILEFV